MWYSAVGFLVTLTLSLLAAPLAAGAQPAGKVWRIGVLTGGVDPESPRGASFRQGLRELGYVEGQNIAMGVTGAIKSHSFIIALNINKLSFSAQRWKSLVMRHMTKNCELDSKSEYLTPFSHSDHHHGSRGPLHESRKLSTIGPTESTFASADSRSDSLNM
jgi:hypothetical protein